MIDSNKKTVGKTTTNKTNAQAQPRKALPPAPIPETANPAEIITAENIKTIGERIAVRALKTVYAKSGDDMIRRLYIGLIADINHTADNMANISDGYDVAQTATAFLCQYIGKALDDKTTDGQTDKDGNPITVLRACFRAVGKYIDGERQKVYKVAYIDDYDAEGNRLYYEIPDEWDIPTATDYKRIQELITELNLPQRQLQVLRYRLRGIAISTNSKRKQDSVRTIAQKMGISPRAVQNLIEKIRAKAVSIGLTPAP